MCRLLSKKITLVNFNEGVPAKRRRRFLINREIEKLLEENSKNWRRRCTNPNMQSRFREDTSVRENKSTIPGDQKGRILGSSRSKTPKEVQTETQVEEDVVHFVTRTIGMTNVESIPPRNKRSVWGKSCACLNCLQRSHLAKNYQRSRKLCFHCKGRHNSVLCSNHHKDVKPENQKEENELIIISSTIADQRRSASKRILLLCEENSVINPQAPKI